MSENDAPKPPENDPKPAPPVQPSKPPPPSEAVKPIPPGYDTFGIDWLGPMTKYDKKD